MPESEHAEALAGIEAMLRAGRAGDAALALAELLARRPDDAEAWNLRGRALAVAGDAVAAERAFARCVELDPGHDRAVCNLAKLLSERGDLEQARGVLESGQARAPDSRRISRALGLLRLRLDRPELAIAPLEAALAMESDEKLVAALVEALDEVAHRAERVGLFATAERHLRRAMALRPDEPSFARRLAVLLSATRRVQEALSLLDAFPAEFEPSLQSTWLHLRHFLPGWTRAEARLTHEAYGARVLGAAAGPPPAPRTARRAGRLRVGYFSRDFRKHAVAWFFLPIARTHDPARVELVLVSDVASPDEITAELRRAARRFVDVSAMSNAELRDALLRLELDVLVDLGAHTAFTRLPVFAEKLAPLQLSYLGYPDRTGLASYDGRIVDGWSDPPELDTAAREPLLRLPVCAWSFEPGVAPLPLERSAREHVVFGSYNFYGKVSDDTARVWGALLRRVPRSRLRLKSASFGEESARDHARRDLGRFGIQAERLDLVPYTRTREEHLRSYTEVDIALDSFPYNGTTTTCEALWMGTPVVCLRGESHAGRVGLSLLEAVGHPELVARDEAQYVEIAASLAAESRAHRAAQAHTLRADVLRSPLGRGRALSLALEELYASQLAGSTAAQ